MSRMQCRLLGPWQCRVMIVNSFPLLYLSLCLTSSITGLFEKI